MTALVRDREGIVSSTYIGFKGVRLCIKGRICFIGLWYILYIEDNTTQYSTVVIIYDNTLHPLFTPDTSCDCSRGLPVFEKSIFLSERGKTN